MPHSLTSLPDEGEHAVPGQPVSPANLGRGRAGCVLTNQALDRVDIKPLADAPLGATVAARRLLGRLICRIRKQRGVQFESPQAD
jgi:hypothetical protein